MKLLIDLASFLNHSPSHIHDCVQSLRTQGHALEYLWQIPEDLAPPPVLTRVVDQQAQNERMLLVDLNGMDQGLAAKAFNDFMRNVDQSVLLVAQPHGVIPNMAAAIPLACFDVITWQGQETLWPSGASDLTSGQTLIPQDKKPSLAIVSPYPPQRSGVADYIAQLMPALSDYYNCVLVIDDGLPETAKIQFPGRVISATEFLAQPELHQRVLYQMGNSPGHLYALPLLEKIPGLVTLHDFYMGDALLYEELVLKKTNAYLQRLLISHGLNVLPVLDKEGLLGCAARYPSNLPVLRDSGLLAIHADYVKTLARETYKRIPESKFVVVPFPKEVRINGNPEERIRLREKYGIKTNDFVVSTFGFGVPTKRHDMLIQAWMESRFAQDPHAHLLIIGEYPNQQYLVMMQQLCEGFASNIRFVGFVDEPVYREYLDITDWAVQLRVNSRGETSAAIMDCLASGVPVIANDHGTVTELSDQIIWKIPDPPSVAQVLTALEYLQANPAVHTDRQQLGVQYLQQHHSLKAAAQSYRLAIEKAATQSVLVREQALVHAAQSQHLSRAGALAVTQCLSFNRPRLGKKQLLIDISEVATHDLRTGIQRVVRSILAEFIQQPPEGFDICPIYLDRQQVYRHARQFMLTQHDRECPTYTDDPVSVHAGDHYLGIDLHPTATADAKHIYADWRAHGVYIVHVLYDLLPIQHPEWFPPVVFPEFTRWLSAIVADGSHVLTISQTVANEMERWLDSQNHLTERPIVGWFHLGADINASIPSTGMPPDAINTLENLETFPSFLMVGTVEPRKGHAQTLAAFEHLWERGQEVNLVIVGKKGWMVDSLAEKILAHPQYRKRLFWLQGISDQYLEEVYSKCVALIAASEGEGFGLPIIEAAKHQIPVIARDIPVFREVGGLGAYYFEAYTPSQLALAIQAWIDLPAAMRPNVLDIPCITWKESAQQILDFIKSTRDRNFYR